MLLKKETQTEKWCILCMRRKHAWQAQSKMCATGQLVGTHAHDCPDWREEKKEVWSHPKRQGVHHFAIYISDASGNFKTDLEIIFSLCKYYAVSSWKYLGRCPRIISSHLEPQRIYNREVVSGPFLKYHHQRILISNDKKIIGNKRWGTYQSENYTHIWWQNRELFYWLHAYCHVCATCVTALKNGKIIICCWVCTNISI